jgi:hypothetical protein
MKTRFKIGIVLILGILVFVLFIQRFRAEHYRIVYTAFLTGTNLDVLSGPEALCYSNKQLKEAVKRSDILDRAGMLAFNLDEPDLMACIISNCTVQEIVGRDDFGLIILKPSQTNGISFTVFKGTKRFLQFNDPRVVEEYYAHQHPAPGKH